MAPIDIVYEDNHLIVVNKASGVLVQGDITGDMPLSEIVKNYIKTKYNKPGNVFTGVVHRLDRPVSGLVLLAKTSKALERMNAQFRDRHIKKTYWAVVKRRPEHPEGVLKHWLIKDSAKNMTKAHNREVANGLYSELSYKLLRELSGYYLLEVLPETGRPHQIRVQLASMGCVIVGDVKYGYKEANSDASINLHARQLEFVHPVSKEQIKIKADLPANAIWQLFK
jgi:23S rRNA pseudouridine1911/1915/1917 synthase